MHCKKASGKVIVHDMAQVFLDRSKWHLQRKYTTMQVVFRAWSMQYMVGIQTDMQTGRQTDRQTEGHR